MNFNKNTVILKEGQICKSIYFITKGFCKATYNLDGKDINTDFFFENEFATNIKSLKENSPSEYTIVTCENTSAIKIDKDKLLDAYKRSHEVEAFGRKVLETIISRQQEHADSFKILSAKQRYKKLVVHHPDFLQRVSLTQVASYLGMSRETLSRLRSLK